MYQLFIVNLQKYWLGLIRRFKGVDLNLQLAAFIKVIQSKLNRPKVEKTAEEKKEFLRKQKRNKRHRTSFSVCFISLLIHLLIIGSLIYFLMPSRKKEKSPVLTTSTISPEAPEEILKEIDIVKEKIRVAVEVEMPIFKTVEIQEDFRETENELEAETAEGAIEAITDLPLVGFNVMGNIGGGGGGGGAFGSRSGGGKMRAVMKGGGSKATESAVEGALDWLSRHQKEDGSWTIVDIDHRFSTKGEDESLTGLAILAFLAAGHTPKIGKHHEAVKAGIDWIIANQKPNGSWGDTHMKIYGASICTLALAECYGMYPDKVIRKSAQRGVHYLLHLKSKNVHMGVKKGVALSTSVGGWIVMALKSAKIAGLKVPKRAFKAYRKRIDEVTDKDNGYRGVVNYNSISVSKKASAIKKGRKYTMTAVGMLCNLYLGVHRSDLSRQAEILMVSLPAWKKLRVSTFIQRKLKGSEFKRIQQYVSFDFYHCYYATLSLFQYGGDSWKEWNKSMKETLLPNQRKGGPVDGSVDDIDGSWDPYSVWGRSKGRVFTTAMGALCLEVYYRYKSVRE